jgi:deferrochelatase/peroxidase EfeB
MSHSHHVHVELDNPEPIDISDSKYEPLLSNLQGNILKSHGRDYSQHLFFRVRDPVLARAWISHFAESRVTSALEQYQQTSRHKQQDQPGAELFCNLMISYAGYLALEIKGIAPKDPVFREGMKAQEHVTVALLEVIASLNLDISVDKSNPLGDPPVNTWEHLFGLHELHVFILLAHAYEDSVTEGSLFVRTDAEKNGLEFIGQETGNVIRNTKDQPIEHFGHPIGVSQPLFLKSDFDQWIKNNNIHTPEQIAKYGNPFASLRVVLDEDPCPSSSAPAYGTYMVYRKLQQNLPAYEKKLSELAAKLGITPDEADTLVVGRSKTGRPLARLHSFPVDEQVVQDNFDFHDSPDIGLPVCPFHAHIRKVF